jgi:hypothetical protein
MTPQTFKVKTMEPQFRWTERGSDVRIYQTRKGDLDRWFSLARVYSAPTDPRPHVLLSSVFQELIPTTAYIYRKKYATHADAQAAVERKVAQLMGVMQITGVWP